MVLFAWDAKYSVGVKELDSQHKVLVDMLNDLYDAMQTQKATAVIGGIISKLVSYTKTHFATEERLMERCSYPELASQQREHAKFTEKVMAFKNDFDAGKVTMTVSVTAFLKDWLSSHILGTDKKYGPYMNSKGIS